MFETIPKKVLIIGGCGYIGSALYTYLYRHWIPSNTLDPKNTDSFLSNPSRQKYQVTTVDLEWFGNFTSPNNIKKDFRDLTVEELKGYDTIILLAGHSSVPMANNSDANSTFNNNVDNFLNLLKKIDQNCDCEARQKFIYAGSSSVYNGIPDDNVTEDYNLLAPANVYDLTKQDIDRYAALFPNIESYGLRFATVNGISDNLRTDIMINAMVENAMKEKAVNLFNGNIRRPILYINDLCRAIQTIIDCEDDKRGVYNLSSFNGTAESIAVGVSEALGVDLKRVDQKQVEAAINSKLPMAYDFSISNEKFSKAFNFKFEGNIGTIVKNVSDHIEGIHTGKRLIAVKYR